MIRKTGQLYIVATPIGNLSDISERARAVLEEVSLVLAEDTRRAGILLSHLGIRTRTKSFHEHNETRQTPEIIKSLEAGADIALISDAGTPLISDPGYVLVREARQSGIAVVPVPGPSAFVAALSVSGLPVDAFTFAGFLPAKSGQRRRRIRDLTAEPRTLVFYESCHRIVASLEDLEAELGPDREVLVAREITKTFESYYSGSITTVLDEVREHADNQKGEFVVVIAGSNDKDSALPRAMELATTLSEDLPDKRSCRIAADTFNVSANRLYREMIASRKP